MQAQQVITAWRQAADLLYANKQFRCPSYIIAVSGQSYILPSSHQKYLNFVKT
jgi:hypothetical protein